MLLELLGLVLVVVVRWGLNSCCGLMRCRVVGVVDGEYCCTFLCGKIGILSLVGLGFFQIRCNNGLLKVNQLH